MRWKVDATVTSRTGSARAPSRIDEPVGPDREVAGDRAGPGVEAGDRLHEEAAFGPAEQLLGRRRARVEVQRPGPDAGRRGVAGPHRRAGGAGAAAPAGVDVVEEPGQLPVLDQADGPGRHALAVVAGGAEGLGVRRVVDDRDVRPGHHLAEAGRRTSTGP